MASTALTQDFVEQVAAEMFSGIDAAVECWMARIEGALTDRKLTTLGRLNAVQEVVQDYKRLSGKVELACRKV
jgi:hypothetical protein